MKRFLLAFFVIMLLSSMSSIVQAQNVNTVQVILKSQNLGFDKDYGVFRANITITANKIGNLTYRESLYYTDYSSGTAGQQTFYRTNSYDNIMKDYTISFLVTRPGAKSEKDSWNSIKATVIIDKNVVFETWISQGGTYKSFITGKMLFTNDSSMQIGKTRPIIEKRPDISSVSPTTAAINDTDTGINDTGNVTKNTTKQSPMVGGTIAIVIILSVYVFIRRNGKNKN